MLVTRSFTAKKPKHRGVGNTHIVQTIKTKLDVNSRVFLTNHRFHASMYNVYRNNLAISQPFLLAEDVTFLLLLGVLVPPLSRYL